MSQFARVRDLVLAMLPSRIAQLTPAEAAFAPHIRGNAPLFEALTAFVNARINGRAMQPVPSDPIECRAAMERDHELRWLLGRLDFIYRSPVNVAASDDEQPA